MEEGGVYVDIDEDNGQVHQLPYQGFTVHCCVNVYELMQYDLSEYERVTHVNYYSIQFP
jgi:hypothetical protein